MRRLSNHSIEIEEYDNELSLKKVIIALKANKQPASMLVEKQDLENYLSTKLDRPVEVIIPSDSSVVVESFRNGTLDLGYLRFHGCRSKFESGNSLNQSALDSLKKMESRIIKVSGWTQKGKNLSVH